MRNSVSSVAGSPSFGSRWRKPLWAGAWPQASSSRRPSTVIDVRARSAWTMGWPCSAVAGAAAISAARHAPAGTARIFARGRGRPVIVSDMIAPTILMRAAICLLTSMGLLALLSPEAAAAEGADEKPLRLAIAGLVHGHVDGFLRAAKNRPGVTIVGIADPDSALHRKYAQRHGLPDAIFFTDVETMLDRVKPEAVASFT